MMNKMVIWQIIWFIAGPLGCIIQVACTMLFGLVSLKTINERLRESLIDQLGEIPEKYITALLVFEWMVRMYVPLYSWILFARKIKAVIRRLKDRKGS